MLSIIPSYVLNFILALLVIVLTTYSQIALRFSLNKLSDTTEKFSINFEFIGKILTNFLLLSSVFAFSLSFICWSVALVNKINVSRAYPIVSSLTIFFVWIINVFIFKDDVSIVHVFGALFVISGIFLLLCS
jgi:multidrug transporter EmrE-like cation transporter